MIMNRNLSPDVRSRGLHETVRGPDATHKPGVADSYFKLRFQNSLTMLRPLNLTEKCYTQNVPWRFSSRFCCCSFCEKI